jgi:hypothetical protein
MSKSNNNMVIVGLAAAASVSLIFYLVTQQNAKAEAEKKTVGSEKRTATASSEKTSSQKSRGLDLPSASAGAVDTPRTPAPEAVSVEDKTPKVKNIKKSEENKSLHNQIEELDKKGKVLFKNKQVR